jgi:hypothetical protein
VGELSHRLDVTKIPYECSRPVFVLREACASVEMRGLSNEKTVRELSHRFTLKEDCGRGQGQGSSSYIGPSAPSGVPFERGVVGECSCEHVYKSI